MRSEESDFEAPTKLRMPDRAIESRRGARGKGKEWGEIISCSSEDQLRSRLTENSGQWVKKKKHRTGEGIKQYMQCKLPDVFMSNCLHGHQSESGTNDSQVRIRHRLELTGTRLSRLVADVTLPASRRSTAT